ncbi:MAG: SDR family oxidoreductase [Spirochaetes bacterium]|nr:SDR family oxidoreductase [Spirochaetota bacterium]
MSNQLPLEGKVAFVTGAASKRGMGRAVALRLASEGADVVVHDKFASPKSAWTGDEDWKGLDDVVKEIEAMGRKSLAVIGGVENTAECDKAVKSAMDKFGKIDILVHCAGIRGPVGVNVVDADEKDWKMMFDVNTIGAFVISKSVGKEMIKNKDGGKMVHISSAAGKEGAKGSAAYAASKWAVLGLVKSLALELAPYNINVNAINPGFFSTNLRDNDALQQVEKTGKNIDDLRKDEYKFLSGMVPLQRMGKVEEIADLIFFLVSDQSAYITGQDININGGTHMH